ncbi:farnesyltransferase [Capsaspora owczarzaki ATCC 30864]|uniref:Protein farnesyltransferase subunit beta n=1 Tax=Capsaspora owczarzaki (strain ATCC 30864) TaxID=595528 RepID=A0A0D2VHJ0_CAPO3|nr:farnesyltransferase [Capsaspora owczarzaki ATCC 30864]KJE89422.1 farnesyltransferase [Capsaspora owczarzaki ATCC 30864]|eukprot:XP_004365763.1 farnesyltransferase [Capsaspora owczarzaki ATCC 30864]
MAVSSTQTIEELLVVDDQHPTRTTAEQLAVESSIERLYADIRYAAEDAANVRLSEAERKAAQDRLAACELRRIQHVKYLKRGLFMPFPAGYVSLDASRPWLCYWSVHALALLGAELNVEQAEQVVQFLKRCRNPDGGFSGSPQQLSHLAPTYAAINTLVTIGTPSALGVIDRERLLSFLYSVKCSNSEHEGGFSMHVDGEVDVRGTYCAVSVASLCQLPTDKLFEGTAEWLLRCQTYEGGFGGVPGVEAHGGYAFCAFAALVMLKRATSCNLKSLLHWLVNRQMRFEGGFQGRTNKLVDGCYSFWQGGTFPSVAYALYANEPNEAIRQALEGGFMNEVALQEYALICCQDPNGGLLDKPGKPRDHYHSCYVLSGVSVAQHDFRDPRKSTVVVGGPENQVLATHPLHNVLVSSVIAASKFYGKTPVVDPHPPKAQKSPE